MAGIGENVTPASPDTTVAPSCPAATACVGDENAAAKICCVEGETSEPVKPASVVRMRWLPVSVAIRQMTPAQRIDVRFAGVAPASGRCDHPAPLSVVV